MSSYANPQGPVTFTITSPPQGWVCPKCGAVYAPNMVACWRCWPPNTPTPPYPTA